MKGKTRMNAIKVTMKWEREQLIDFVIASDDENVYRYDAKTEKIRKLVGFGKNNFGKAIRGEERKKIEALAKIVYDNNLPFAIIA